MFAAIYAVVKQASGISQRLVTAKSCLAKQGVTIPRLELVPGHMAVNLITNLREALEGLTLKTTAGWTVPLRYIGLLIKGSTVSLFRIVSVESSLTQTCCGVMFRQQTTPPI